MLLIEEIILILVVATTHLCSLVFPSLFKEEFNLLAYPIILLIGVISTIMIYFIFYLIDRDI